MDIRQGVVLVGGRGTRLGEITRNIPKPLLEVSPGLRFLDVLLFDLARHGFSDILLLAGHHGDQVEQLYQGRRILDSTVRVLREPEPQGTGGALKFASAALDEAFLLAPPPPAPPTPARAPISRSGKCPTPRAMEPSRSKAKR